MYFICFNEIKELFLPFLKAFSCNRPFVFLHRTFNFLSEPRRPTLETRDVNRVTEKDFKYIYSKHEVSETRGEETIAYNGEPSHTHIHKKKKRKKANTKDTRSVLSVPSIYGPVGRGIDIEGRNYYRFYRSGGVLHLSNC